MRASTRLTMAALTFVQPPALHDEATPWIIWPAGNRGTLDEFVATLDGLTEPTIICFHAESRAEVSAWMREVVLASVGWTPGPSDGDPRAPIRLFLMKPDRTWSPGLR